MTNSRGEHFGRDAHHVVETAENQSKMEHLLVSHITVSRRSAMWYIFQRAALLLKATATYVLIAVARVGDGVNRMSKPITTSLFFTRLRISPLPRPAFHNAVEFPATPHSPTVFRAPQQSRR